MMALIRPMNKKRQLCGWSMSAKLVLAVVAAFAFSGHAQAQVVTSPWTASDLQGGIPAVSGVSAGGTVFSASTEPIVLASTNTAIPMELSLTVATTSAIPEDTRLAIWENEQTFSSGGLDTLSASVLLNESAFEVIEENFTVANNGSPVHVYTATFNESNLGTAQYTSLVNAVDGNPDNVYSLYGNGESLLTIFSMPVEGGILIYLNPEGNFFQFDDGLAIQASLSPIASVPQLGDVDLDGDVDFADIPAFIAVLISGDFQAEADCDESGVVDFSDIPAFIAILIGS